MNIPNFPTFIGDGPSGAVFAFRATDPVDMYRQTDRVGKLNDEVLQIVPALMGRTVMAWGAGAVHRKLGADANRCAMLQGWLREYPQVYYLRKTKHGHPEHPLYVPGDVVPVLWGCCEINKRMEQSE